MCSRYDVLINISAEWTYIGIGLCVRVIAYVHAMMSAEWTYIGMGFSRNDRKQANTLFYENSNILTFPAQYNLLFFKW